MKFNLLEQKMQFNFVLKFEFLNEQKNFCLARKKYRNKTKKKIKIYRHFF